MVVVEQNKPPKDIGENDFALSDSEYAEDVPGGWPLDWLFSTRDAFAVMKCTLNSFRQVLHRMRKSNAGITLAELILSVGVSGILLLAIATTMTLMVNNHASLTEKIETEEETHTAAFMLRHFFSMALNLIDSGGGTGSLNGGVFNANLGRITQYNLDGWAATNGPGVIDVVSYFIREGFISGDIKARITAGTAPPVGPARFPMTGIFFQRPTVDRYGVLYIGTATAGAKFGPTDSDYKVGRIVDFQISEIFSQTFQAAGGAGYPVDADIQGQRMVTGVTMKIVTRNYRTFSADGNMTWCPPKFMPSGATPDPACTTSLTYKDTEKSFTFTVRNNVIGRSLSLRGTDLNTTGPNNGLVAPTFRRPVESLYFLSPAIPIGAISR